MLMLPLLENFYLLPAYSYHLICEAVTYICVYKSFLVPPKKKFLFEKKKEKKIFLLDPIPPPKFIFGPQKK